MQKIEKNTHHYDKVGKLGFFMFWRGFKKGVYFIGALEGLWPPIGLTKISKIGGVMDRCLKTEIFITLHFWGVKGGEKVH